MKNLQNLGKALSKAEQKNINGGVFTPNSNTGYASTIAIAGNYNDECQTSDDCPSATNPDGSLMTVSCTPTSQGHKCTYKNF